MLIPISELIASIGLETWQKYQKATVSRRFRFGAEIGVKLRTGRIALFICQAFLSCLLAE